jgi:hypothetical protein
MGRIFELMADLLFDKFRPQDLTMGDIYIHWSEANIAEMAPFVYALFVELLNSIINCAYHVSSTGAELCINHHSLSK